MLTLNVTREPSSRVPRGIRLCETGNRRGAIFTRVRVRRTLRPAGSPVFPEPDPEPEPEPERGFELDPRPPPWVWAGVGRSRTVPVTAEAAWLTEEIQFPASTTTRSVEPASAAPSEYVAPVAPAMFAQCAPAVSQRCQR